MLLVALVFAMIVITKHINITTHIIGFGMTIYGTDKTTELTEINMGDLTVGETYGFPSSGTYWLNNTGEVFIYAVSFNTTSMPSYLNITCYIKRGETNYASLSEGELWSVGIPASEGAQWYFNITVAPDAPSGDLNFTLNWRAHNSVSG